MVGVGDAAENRVAALPRNGRTPQRLAHQTYFFGILSSADRQDLRLERATYSAAVAFLKFSAGGQRVEAVTLKQQRLLAEETQHQKEKEKKEKKEEP